MAETSTSTVQKPMDANQIAALAREKVMAIKPMDKVLEALGISPEVFAQIEQLPYFQHVVKTFAIEWESATSTNKRIELQAAAALEEALPGLAKRMMDGKEALPAVVQTAQFIGKLAGAGEEKSAQGAQGDKFKIIFNLGADTVKFDEKGSAVTLSATVVESPNADSKPSVALPAPVNEKDVGPDLSGFPVRKNGTAPV